MSIEKLRAAIQSSLDIKTLWLPPCDKEEGPDHQGEYQALSKMEQMFNNVLNEAKPESPWVMDGSEPDDGRDVIVIVRGCVEKCILTYSKENKKFFDDDGDFYLLSSVDGWMYFEIPQPPKGE